MLRLSIHSDLWRQELLKPCIQSDMRRQNLLKLSIHSDLWRHKLLSLRARYDLRRQQVLGCSVQLLPQISGVRCKWGLFYSCRCFGLQAAWPASFRQLHAALTCFQLITVTMPRCDNKFTRTLEKPTYSATGCALPTSALPLLSHFGWAPSRSTVQNEKSSLGLLDVKIKKTKCEICTTASLSFRASFWPFLT